MFTPNQIWLQSNSLKISCNIHAYVSIAVDLAVVVTTSGVVIHNSIVGSHKICLEEKQDILFHMSENQFSDRKRLYWCTKINGKLKMTGLKRDKTQYWMWFLCVYLTINSYIYHIAINTWISFQFSKHRYFVSIA